MDAIAFLERLIETNHYFIADNRFTIDNRKLYFIRKSLVLEDCEFTKAHKFLKDIIKDIKSNYELHGGDFTSYIDLVSMKEVHTFMTASPSTEDFLNSLLPSYGTTSNYYEYKEVVDYHSMIAYGVGILESILKHM